MFCFRLSAEDETIRLRLRPRRTGSWPWPLGMGTNETVDGFGWGSRYIAQDPDRTKSQSCERRPYLTLESPRRIRLLQQFYLAPLQRKLLRGDIYNEGLSLIANAQEPSCCGILTGASLSDCAECAWSALLSQCVMTCDFREPSFSYMTEPIIELAE